MRIIITQAEIEESIAEKVLSQMSINENCELKINLAATRGEEGYTATIDVVEKAEAEPVRMPGRRRKSAEATTTAAAPTPVEDTKQVEEAAPETTQEADSTEETQDEPAPTTGRANSIFGGLRKPVNEPAGEE